MRGFAFLSRMRLEARRPQQGRWDVDPLRSCDQGFVYDPVFRSDDDEIAMAFDTGWLSDSELQTLERRTSIWVEAHICEAES